MLKQSIHLIKRAASIIRKFIKNYWKKGLWQKIVCIFWAFLIIAFAVIWSVGEYYIVSQENVPLQLGVSFIPDQAEEFGLNPQQTMNALLNIGVKHFRLTSYWSDMQTTKGGAYDFSTLDWEFKNAEAHHAKIILAVGLRQPDWPECHMPTWADSEPESQWQPQLEKFMTAVVDRYKHSPALESYQLENEYFNKGFGYCTNYSRQRLIDEYALMKKLDSKHPTILGSSNNTVAIPFGKPKGDIFSISIYRHVWDASVTHRYLTYPYTSHWYAFMAGIQKIFYHRPMIIAEMQAEAWAPNYKAIAQTSLAEQNKSSNAKILNNDLAFAKGTGMKQIYLWGAEYWYYRMTVLHDPSLWNTAKKFFEQSPSS
jgi:hypothetical protein